MTHYEYRLAHPTNPSRFWKRGTDLAEIVRSRSEASPPYPEQGIVQRREVTEWEEVREGEEPPKHEISDTEHWEVWEFTENGESRKANSRKMGKDRALATAAEWTSEAVEAKAYRRARYGEDVPLRVFKAVRAVTKREVL